jgi:NTF2-related export protein 1/2
MDQVIDVSAKAAVKFTSTYYETMDKQRHLISKLYGENAVLVWNGNPYIGQEIGSFLLQFPLTKTEILSYDAQPTQGDLLVQSTGLIIYGNEKPKAFSQVFILKSSGGTQYSIASDTFRFV